MCPVRAGLLPHRVAPLPRAARHGLRHVLPEHRHRSDSPHVPIRLCLRPRADDGREHPLHARHFFRSYGAPRAGGGRSGYCAHHLDGRDVVCGRGVLRPGLSQSGKHRLPHPAPGDCRLHRWDWYIFGEDVLRGLDRHTVRSRIVGKRLAAVGVECGLRGRFTYPTALRQCNKAHGPAPRADLLFGHRARVLLTAVHERRDNTRREKSLLPLPEHGRRLTVPAGRNHGPDRAEGRLQLARVREGAADDRHARYLCPHACAY
mmetsp:Transcript_21644/g.56481  ORF Transcript_21644/g.56481 Transcript_21644/m.56481 type:complete len:261 (+) Transcript_21644:422-1204(+)